MITIAILWLLSNILLMILIYHTSLKWSPNDCDQQICVIDTNSQCFDVDNRVWLFVNILFIVLLIVSTLWAGELGNVDGGPIRTMSGVLILLGGLVLAELAIDHYDFISLQFWMAVGYLIIWFGLTLYIIIS